jgi:hypothetical protein
MQMRGRRGLLVAACSLALLAGIALGQDTSGKKIDEKQAFNKVCFWVFSTPLRDFPALEIRKGATLCVFASEADRVFFIQLVNMERNMMDNVKGMLKGEEAAKSARNAAASAVARDAAAARQVSQLKRCLCVSGASDGCLEGGQTMQSRLAWHYLCDAFATTF